MICEDWSKAADFANRLGPEHLEVQVAGAESLVPLLDNYGALFIGQGSAEVLGVYGAGPNHVLPTSGTSRYRGGLSVFDFLRVRTWIEIKDAQDASPLYRDASEVSALEGLSGHGLSARLRDQPRLT